MRTATPLAFVLLPLTLVACGGSAESAEEPAGSAPAVTEAPAVPETVSDTVAEPEAADAPPRVAEAPPARPARRTTPPPAETQVPEPAPEPAPARSVAQGTALTLTLDQTLSTQANRAGDPFTAHLTVDLLAPDGEVLLPAGTRVRGLVTEAQESPGPDAPALLRLRVVDVTVDGQALAFVADVEDVALEADTRDSNRESATKVAVGTAAGALLGKLTGQGGKKGAVVGAAAGAAVAIASRDGHARIPEGSRIVIRVLEPLILP